MSAYYHSFPGSSSEDSDSVIGGVRNLHLTCVSDVSEKHSRGFSPGCPLESLWKCFKIPDTLAPHRTDQWEVREKSLGIDIFKFSRLFQWASRVGNHWAQLHHADNNIEWVGNSLLYPPDHSLPFFPLKSIFHYSVGQEKT